ncbi:21270_t:CDS:1, partial [Dentiscutata erythropus]
NEKKQKTNMRLKQNSTPMTNVERKGAEMDETNEEKQTNQMQANTNKKA